MNISYTINNIDNFGTVNFSFTIGKQDYTCGENFGQFSDITNADGSVTTAGQQLDQAIQNYIQQHLPNSVPDSIQSMIGTPQVATQVDTIESQKIQEATPVQTPPIIAKNVPV